VNFLGQNLTEMLNRRFGGNMAAFAKATGVHRNQLDLYCGGALPSFATVLKIAQAMGVSPAYLVGSSEERAALDGAKTSSELEARVSRLEARLAPEASQQAEESEAVMALRYLMELHSDDVEIVEALRTLHNALKQTSAG